MIPLILKIQGIFSYQEEAIIDFRKLAQANIFGIFGKVGSGKSTILEAIMFALYGEVARMGTNGRSYNMMNLRSNQMKIDFTFDVGSVIYRILVEANRKKKNFEQVDTPTFRYFILQNEEWQPFEGFNAAEILGIEAQHFKKTIIIPQNEFQKFLELSPTERTRMIKDIFINLEKFELEENTKTLDNQNKIEILNVENQLRDIGVINNDIIENQQKQLDELQKAKNKNDNKITSLKTEEKNLHELKSMFDELAQLKNQAAQLTQTVYLTPHGEVGIDMLQKQIADYEYYLEFLKTPLEQQITLQKNIEQNQAELESIQKQLTINQQNASQLQKQLDELTPQYDDRDTLLKKRDELTWLIDIQQQQIAKLDVLQRIEKGKVILTNHEEIRQNLQTQKAPFVQQREDLLKNQPDFQRLSNINNWFTTLHILKKELSDVDNKILELKQSITGLDEKRLKISQFLYKKFETTLPLQVTVQEIILTVKDLKKILESQKQEAENQLIHLRATEQLEAISNALSEGTPCPLCGATHHPSVWNAQNVHKQLTDTEKQLDKIRNDSSTLQNTENELITLLQNLNNSKGLLVEWQKKSIIEKQNLEQHDKNFVWTEFDKSNYISFQRVFEEANLFGDKLKKAQSQIDNIEKKWAENNEFIERCKSRLSELQSELNKYETTIDNLWSRLILLTNPELLKQPTNILKKQAEQFDNDYHSITNKYTGTDKKLKELTEKSQLLRGGANEKRNNHVRLVSDFQQLSEQFDKLLQSSPFTDKNELEKWVKQPFDLVRFRQTVENFKKQQAEINGQINKLTARLEGKSYDFEKHESLIYGIETLSEQINQQISQIAVLEVEIKNLKDKLDKYTSLKTEHDKLEVRAKNLEILRGMFARSGFVNFVSTKYLVNLCHAANERFLRFTRGQLRLKVTDSNDFEIEDLFNFGKTRHVKTLSGGQIFQASLALALALADSIQALSRTEQNFFFLDEGFGSLDRDSMQEVFNTLKSLRKENRIVGVISHVEEMQQEIDRYLKVTLDSEKGSQVETI